MNFDRRNITLSGMSRILVAVVIACYLVEMARLPSDRFFNLSDWQKLSVCGSLILLAFIFALDLFKRTSAFIIWIFFAIFINRYPLFREIQTTYLSLILVFYFMLDQESDRKNDRYLFAYLLAYGISYSFQGYAKFLSPEWLSGQNLLAFTEFSPFHFTSAIANSIPAGAFQFIGWLVAGYELLALPLIISKKTRYFYMVGIVVLHALIGILASNLLHISLVMAVYNLQAYSVFKILDERRRLAALKVVRTTEP